MNSKAYTSNLTDAEWLLLEPFIPAAKLGGITRSTDMMDINPEKKDY
jgi:transposase